MARRTWAACFLALITGAAPAADEGSLARIRADLFYLAGPECAGRGVNTPGNDKAAEYIAGQFRAAGLKPVGADGSYFQPFRVNGAPKLVGTPTLALQPEGGRTKPPPMYRESFAVLGLSASKSVTAGVVFAGYGITSPDKPAYDDYAGLDAAGKWVVVVRQAPRAGTPNPAFDPMGSPHPALTSKVANAVAHKAAGVLFVNHASEKGDPLVEFGYAAGPDEGIPVLQIKRPLADELLRTSGGAPLADAEAAIDRDLKPQSRPIPGANVAAEVTIERPTVPARNVVGVLEGSGPLADETVVIGAHFDHLGDATGLASGGSLGGRGGRGKVHYGADDNASGTCGVIELARRFAAVPNRQGRRLVFAAFSGEEIDLLGSKHYVKNPPFPLDSTAFMLNMDMIGRSLVLADGGLAAAAGAALPAAKPEGFGAAQRLVVHGVGTAEGLEASVAELSNGSGFKLIPQKAGTGPSDHDSFYRKQIPVLFVYTGSHSDYHRPSDTPERVDLPGVGMVVDLVEKYAARAATAARPKFVRVSEGWSDPTEPARPRRSGPKLGIMPGNYESADGGVLVDGVSPGGAAEKGGVAAGDVIVEIAGKPVKNIGGYMAAMAGQQPGKEIELVVVRKDRRLALKVTPAQ